MFTPYSVLIEDCSYMFDSSGKVSYKCINCMCKTTIFFPCSALNNDNERFPESIAPASNSKGLHWWYGSSYLSWCCNAEVNDQFDF